MKFKESQLAHHYLDGLEGLEIGGSAHNTFGLNTQNIDYTADMGTVFKQFEIRFCGEAMPVDIVANGDALPIGDKSVDFVISSHVIEHFWDPVKALKEWQRVARRFIFVICPQPDALESDRSKPLTSIDELLYRHSHPEEAPVEDTHDHYTRWTCASFLEMCACLDFHVVAHQDPDDKVGNGFAIVIAL